MSVEKESARRKEIDWEFLDVWINIVGERGIFWEYMSILGRLFTKIYKKHIKSKEKS